MGPAPPGDRTSSLLAGLSRAWDLRIGERLVGGAHSQVFACVRHDREPLVLKFSHAEFDPALEAAALRVWDGEGAVRLKAFDRDSGALLMEQIVPGTPLPAGDHECSIAIAADVLRKLHGAPVPASHGFPFFEKFFERILARWRVESEPGTAGLPLLDLARETAGRLSHTASPTVLLHGDFLDKNLLLGPDGYVAIDPVPRIGDPCSDVGIFASFRQPARIITWTARRLAARLGLGPDRAETWAVVWAVGEACETWRADSDDLQAWVTLDATDMLSRVF